MGLKIGGSTSKTSSTSNSSFNNTTTPIVPEWASSLTQDVAGRVGEVNRLDPYSLVAPANGLQARAAAGAESLSGLPWNFDAAADLMRGVAGRQANTYQPSFGVAQGYDPAQGSATSYDAASYGGAQLGPVSNVHGQSLLDNLDSYISPYRRDVVDSALADYDFGAGQTRAQQDLDLAASGAFGGSGAALTRSMTEDALTRGRATTSANLLDQMFQRGAALSANDADRRQQASLANAAAANQASLSQASFQQQAGLANQEALNQARAFGASAQNQYGLANLDAMNQARAFGASAQNQFGLANMAAANEAGRLNAEAQDQALQRQLDAARGLTDLSGAYDANQRANIATQAGIGGAMRDIDQQQRQAPVTHAQQVVAMLSGLPISLFTGEQQTGTSTASTKGKSSSLNFDLVGKIPGLPESVYA